MVSSSPFFFFSLPGFPEAACPFPTFRRWSAFFRLPSLSLGPGPGRWSSSSRLYHGLPVTNSSGVCMGVLFPGLTIFQCHF